jgi:malate synthase
VRGARVIRYVQDFLDRCFPLRGGSHRDATAYVIADRGALAVRFADGTGTTLSAPSAFRGYTGEKGAPTAIFLVHHGIHVEIRIDRLRPIGSTVPAGLRDVLLESALTTIQDCEDSVAAVDADDKVRIYRNWLGLMTGTLETSFMKGNRRIERRLEADRHLRAPNGDEITLSGRSLMLVRHVGANIF